MRRSLKTLIQPFSETSREQRMELAALAGSAIAVFIFLRWCYPMGAYCLDSADYVYSAELGHMRGYRPMGYPWFLQAIHFFSESMSTVLTVQFTIYLSATLFFVTTIRRYFPPAKLWLYRTFAALTVLNTAGMSMTVWYMSDCLNTALILVAVSCMLRLLQEPRNRFMTILLVISLGYAMQTRFASLFFGPAIILAFLFVLRWRKSWPQVLLICVVMAGTWFFNVKANEARFGESVFSGFGGWANANNASVIIPFVKPDTASWKEPEARRAYKAISAFPTDAFSEEGMLRADFLWLNNGPGKKFMFRLRQENPDWSYEEAWVHSGKIYAEMSSHLVKEFPFEYVKRFLWPNTKQLFSPRRDLSKFPEFKVPPTFHDYYGVKEETFSCKKDVLAQSNTFVLERYQGMFVLFIISIIGVWLTRRKLPWEKAELVAVNTLAFMVVITLGGLLIAHPIMFRYVGWYTLFFLVPCYALVNAMVRKK